MIAFLEEGGVGFSSGGVCGEAADFGDPVGAAQGARFEQAPGRGVGPEIAD